MKKKSGVCIFVYMDENFRSSKM
uniref:Uncharacterized protein n=1 Tax=Rhizophora mucronata TaxID=61149 RepID=A0A2P2QT64_RHIMU